MKVGPIPRFALVTFAGFAVAALGLLGLSYVDVRAATGSNGPMPVSVTANSTHILVVRWRVGPYEPDHDMAGNYVLWTLRPFREVYWFK